MFTRAKKNTRGKPKKLREKEMHLKDQRSLTPGLRINRRKKKKKKLQVLSRINGFGVRETPVLELYEEDLSQQKKRNEDSTAAQG